jgi:hypothetical protein
VSLQSGRRYEFALARSGSPTLHIYYEPFVRSDYALRLLASDALTAYTGNRPGSVSSASIRYKELWGDVPGETDDLSINGTSVCTASLCPWTKQVNAYFAFDDNRNGHTDLISDPVVGNIPFLAAADVFAPSSPTAAGTTTFRLLSRGKGPAHVVKTPNWDSVGGGPVVQWRDFERSEVKAPHRH